jgi:aryl-alcohol dehydrogenase-like predicted oxidoreductase
MHNPPAYPATFQLGGDLEINRLGFGAMRITGPQIWGPPEDRPAMLALLRRAVELGVNFIDTADMYGPFTSEELIAEALHPYPAGVVVGTKGGLVRFGPWADFLNDATPQHLHDALEGSLRRLHLEHIDLYQLHRIDPRLPAEKTFGFLAEAQRQGRVRHLGLSEVSVEEIKHAQQYFTVASVQNRYSLFEREAEPVLEYCRAQGIAFIPWFPIGGGQEIGQSPLQQVAERHQASERQVALAWLLHHTPNILLIPGTSSIAHLEENMGAAELRLTADDMQALDAIRK